VQTGKSATLGSVATIENTAGEQEGLAAKTAANISVHRPPKARPRPGIQRSCKPQSPSCTSFQRADRNTAFFVFFSLGTYEETAEVLR